MPLFHFIQDLGEQAEAADAADDAVHPGEARTTAVGQEAPAVSNLPAPVHIGQNEREGLPEEEQTRTRFALGSKAGRQSASGGLSRERRAKGAADGSRE